jgi:hypothetical protein
MAQQQTTRKTRKASDEELPCEGTSAATVWGRFQVTEEGARAAARQDAREAAAEGCAEKKCTGGKRCAYTEQSIEILEMEEGSNEDGVIVYSARAKSSGRCSCK